MLLDLSTEEVEVNIYLPLIEDSFNVMVLRYLVKSTIDNVLTEEKGLKKQMFHSQGNSLRYQ